jgi:hypothetical protein
MLNTLPKTINNFCEIFNILCDSLIDIKNFEQYCIQINNINIAIPHMSNIFLVSLLTDEDIIKFVNEYNLSFHLDYFKKSDNILIQNIVIQNMLNNKICHNVVPTHKMIKLSGDIYKKNVKNIDYILNNLIKCDYNMYVTLHNYKHELEDYKHIDMETLKTFLCHIQSTTISDDYIFKNYTISQNEENGHWFFDYFYKNKMSKCLDILFSKNNVTFSKNHVRNANTDIMNVLIKYKDGYINENSFVCAIR